MGRGARKPRGFRDIDGILLLNKPPGISSNNALQRVRYLYQANKAGHTGSLDPLAMGLLPVCFGQATKFSSYLLDASKTYRALCQLGQTTTTGDAEGEIISEVSVSVNEYQVETVLSQFRGRIEQIPPMHSAVKYKGQRLYHLARTGREITREARPVEIYALKMTGLSSDQLEIEVHCSKGTYIRTLAEDIGKALGCGAFVARLQRTGVHPFWNLPSYTPDNLSSLAEQGLGELDGCLLPVHSALTDVAEMTIDSMSVKLLQQGQCLQIEHAQQPGLLKLMSQSGQFIGLGEVAADARISAKRLMNTTA